MNLALFKNEFAAGLIGALATLPQAVAYGLIAVAPLGPEWAVFGITASVASAILFGFLTASFGSNPFLISGPRAVTALVLAVAIEEGLKRGFTNENAIVLAFSGVFVAGILQFLAGSLRLGQVVSFVPAPVLAGFVTASAIMVGLSSLPMMIGLPALNIYEIINAADVNWNLWALGVGLITIAAIFLLEKRIQLIPSALAGLSLGTFVYYLGLHSANLPSGPVVGVIDLSSIVQGNFLILSDLEWKLLFQQVDIPILAGISIALLASFDTVLTGSALETEVVTHSNANHDLQVHGMANVVMGCFGFLPGSGAHSRSSALILAGARTRAANILSALVFFILIAGLTSLVAAMPLWATSGMLIATAIQAIDKPTLKKIWKILGRKIPYRRVLLGDVLVALVVVFIAIAFDLIMAVGVGIGISIVLFILGMGRDPVRRYYSGHLVHSKVQRPIQHIEYLKQQGRQIAIVELQGALFFGSCAKLQTQVKNCLVQGARYLILDFRHLNSIDSSGAVLLSKLQKMFQEVDGQMYLTCIEKERRLENKPLTEPIECIETRKANNKIPWIWLNLSANNVITRLGEDSLFDDTDSALCHCEDLLLQEQINSSTNPKRRIKNSSIFTGLCAKEIAELGRYTQRKRFTLDEVVFNQGETGDRIFYLLKGRMDVMIDIPGSARKRRISALTEGTLFGEMGLIDGSPRSATIKATCDSICLSIDGLKLSELEKQHPHIAFILMRNMNQVFAQRLRIASDIISELER